MSLPLRHNLTSDYLDAARRLSPPKKRRRIVAYVESYDDVAFWRTLLSEFETDERYFQVMLPSQTSLSMPTNWAAASLPAWTATTTS